MERAERRIGRLCNELREAVCHHGKRVITHHHIAEVANLPVVVEGCEAHGRVAADLSRLCHDEVIGLTRSDTDVRVCHGAVSNTDGVYPLMGYEVEGVFATSGTAARSEGERTGGVGKSDDTRIYSCREIAKASVGSEVRKPSAHILALTLQLRADLLRDGVDTTRLVSRGDIAERLWPLVADACLLRESHGGEVHLSGEEIFGYAAEGTVAVAFAAIYEGSDGSEHTAHVLTEFVADILIGYLHDVEERTGTSLIVNLRLVAVQVVLHIVYSVEEIDLGLTAVVVGRQDGVEVVAVEEYQCGVGVVLVIEILRTVVGASHQAVHQIVVRLVIADMTYVAEGLTEVFADGLTEHCVQAVVVAVVFAIAPRGVGGGCHVVGVEFALSGRIGVRALVPRSCIRPLVAHEIEAHQLETACEPILPALHLCHLFRLGLVLLQLLVVGNELGTGAVIIAKAWIVRVDDIDIATEYHVVRVRRVLLTVNLLSLTESVLEGLHAVVRPCFVVGAIYHIVVGRHTEITQREVVVKTLEGERALVAVIAEGNLVELTLAEGTHSVEFGLVSVGGILGEVKEAFLIDSHTDGGVGPVHRHTARDRHLHVVVEARGTHLVRLHRGSIVNLVHQLRGLRTADIAGVERSVIHSALVRIVAPAVAVEPAVDDIYRDASLLRIGERGVVRSLYTVAVEVHGVGTVLASGFSGSPAEVLVNEGERDVDDERHLVEFGLAVVFPIGVGRRTLRGNHQTLLTLKRSCYIGEVCRLTDGSAKGGVVVCDLPIAGIARILVLVHFILVLAYPSEAAITSRL